MSDYKAKLAIPFRLPLKSMPRVVFETDYLFEGGRLMVDGACILCVPSRSALEAGASALFAEGTLGVRIDVDE